MDHFMPEMDGIETVKIIREFGYNRPIVALTANALVGQADMFMENGFDGFISKPIDIRQLNATLNKLIRDRYPAETVEAARRLKDSLEKMRAVSAETLADYRVSVHGVKSTSESIGAQEARRMAAELEAFAKAGDLSGVLAKNEALIRYVDEFLGNIRIWLERLDA